MEELDMLAARTEPHRSTTFITMQDKCGYREQFNRTYKFFLVYNLLHLTFFFSSKVGFMP